ncbi:MAG: GTP 3',8-cyclase MoaA [Candidatus Ranarchaeia archaeon]
MKDPFGREIYDLRISVTQRCNQFCIYCHREGQDDVNLIEMTPDEMKKITEAAVAVGVKKIKITGGEPLVRKDIVEIVEKISKVQGIQEISMTTNGTLLKDKVAELKEAGLKRVNISLDSLNEKIYSKITKTNFFNKVIKGFFAARKANLTPIKLNMVYLNELNTGELDRVIDFATKNGAIVQIIELVSTTGCETKSFYQQYHQSLDQLEEKLEKISKKVEVRNMHSRKKYYLPNNAIIELVGPMHNSTFCNSCHRLRVTSDGKIKPCLLRNDNLVDILTPLRSGASSETLIKLFEEAIGLRAPYFKD